jgi:3-oxoacyl-[acyl-carrier protein] reductase
MTGLSGAMMWCMDRPLTGRVAVVTGVSRRSGIGFAITRRLLAAGASVLAHSWSAHDADQPLGADPGGIEAVAGALGGPGPRLAQVEADFAQPDSPAAIIDEAVRRFGTVDVLVANHARSSSYGLAEVTAKELDLTWAVNTRATLLLVQSFAAHHDDQRPGGRVVLFTSGQHLAPMPREIPYAVSKGAIHQVTLTLADALADRGITVNALNPGPTDTGWATAELTERLGRAWPQGRWGSPEDAASVVMWLASDEAAWVTGQVINAEGGFRRWTD